MGHIFKIKLYRIDYSISKNKNIIVVSTIIIVYDSFNIKYNLHQIQFMMIIYMYRL